MPLPPPYENVSESTQLSYKAGRYPGSYNGAYTASSSMTEIWRHKIRSWVRVPKSARHLTNPYTSDLYTSDPAGSYIITWENYFGGSYRDYNYHSGNLRLPSDFEAWLASKVSVSSTHPLLTQARNSVLKQAAGQTFNAALFAAEAGKTLELLFSTASKIARSFREIKHGRVMGLPPKEIVRRACSAIGIVQSKAWDPKASRASQWLEYRYGVETLMMDVRDAAEYAASKMSDQPERHSWSSSRTEATQVQSSLFVGLLTGTIQSGICDSHLREWQVKYLAKAWLTAELEVPGYRSMQQLGFANPVALAWELLPGSFVADWALGIGNYLDLQSSLWGLRVVDAGYSLMCEGFASAKLQVAPIASVTGATTRHAKYSRYQRWVWSNPSPEYTFGSGLTIKRAIDAAALFAGFRSR